jgi:DNA-binding transcriptional LysR family regulator
VCLLQRTTRRITVTPEGREYYEKAVRILKELDEIDASFRASRNKPKGHLRVAVGGSTARDVLIPLLADFMTTYPDIRIDLAVADSLGPYQRQYRLRDQRRAAGRLDADRAQNRRSDDCDLRYAGLFQALRCSRVSR